MVPTQSPTSQSRWELMRVKHIVIVVGCIGLVLSGCDLFRDYEDPGSAPRCEPGEVEECPCIDGSMGDQTCTADGVFGPCECGSDIMDAGYDADASPADTTIDVDDAEDAGTDTEDTGTDTEDAGADTDAGDEEFRPLEGTEFIALATGENTTCGVTANGEIRCVGEMEFEESDLADVGELAVGSGHVCVVASDAVFCRGDNERGQLGRSGEQDDAFDAIDWSEESPEIGALAVGRKHSVVLTGSNESAAWGDNRYRQSRPGLTNPEDLLDPVREASSLGLLDSDYSAIGAGGRHSCSLNDEQNLDCWGSNTHGQLGFEPCEPNDPPCSGDKRLSRLEGSYIDMGLGRAHTCALESSGDVTCWGDSEKGQLGTEDEPMEYQFTPPIELDQLADSLGDTQCGWSGSGDVVCWGDNEYGQATPTNTQPVVQPQLVELPADAVHVESGIAHTCALLETGHIRCWGANTEGQIGEFELY